MKIFVGSTNPVKIETTRRGFELMFPKEKIEITGYSVKSEVPDQPIGDEQTLLGATNRVKNLRLNFPDADFYVGLEGGMYREHGAVFAAAWIVIEDGHGLQGKSRTGSFQIPPEVVKLVDQGMELGHADDIVFKTKDSKSGQGATGILTNGLMNRVEYYKSSVILALIPFVNKKLYVPE